MADIPDISTFELATVGAEDLMATLYGRFAVSSKWDLVANGGDADAFTISPDNADENFQINLRRTSASTVRILIDPMENVSDPGGTGSAATITDDSRTSMEADAVVIDGSEHDVVTVMEFKSVICVFFADSSRRFIQRGFMAGRVFVPEFVDGESGGQDYIDGLGALVGVPVLLGTSGGGRFWTSTTGDSFARIGKERWHQGIQVNSVQVENSDGARELLQAINVAAYRVTGSDDLRLGYFRHIYYMPDSLPQGLVMESGDNELPAQVHFWGTDTSSRYAMAWRRDALPTFSGY
jgi:hypothetical protein